jgi:HK97 family phage portal protein
MGWPFTQRTAQITAETLLGWRTAARSGIGPMASVSRDTALRHSAVWACLRLRADLVSMMPVDVYRKAQGQQIEVPPPPVLVNPGGDQVSINEWMYSTQFDLDSTGNAFGLITERGGLNGMLPSRIDLVPATDVVVEVRKGKVQYRIGNTVYQPDEVWHERQFTMSGMPVGMSPTAHAASSVTGYLSAQQFAADWFSGGATPADAHEEHSKRLDPDEALIIKDRFQAAVSNGGMLVTGNDWDYSILSAKASEAMFLEERKFGIGDIARFYGVPGDMIDAETASGSITYANVTQRNLQLLIMNIGPSITRRERAFSDQLVQKPRYVKLCPDALLKMDLKSRYDSYAIGVENRFIAPSEVRALEDRPPFTQPQIDEFTSLFGPPGTKPPDTTPGSGK